jgi:replicative DNA helicase
MARLSTGDFADPMVRAIFAALVDMHHKGVFIDGATLAAYLNASGIARQVGTINLDAIQDMAIPAAKIEPYVTLLQDYAAKRRYVDLGQAIIDRALAHRPGDPPLSDSLLPLLQAGRPATQPTAGRLAATALELSTQAFSGPTWLLERLFVAGGLNLLAGEVASGKTFLALDLALAVAAGELAWDDRPALHGPVLYFCLDCSPRTIQQRLLALCAGRGLLPPADLHFDFSPLNLADSNGSAAGLSFLRQ